MSSRRSRRCRPPPIGRSGSARTVITANRPDRRSAPHGPGIDGGTDLDEVRRHGVGVEGMTSPAPFPFATADPFGALVAGRPRARATSGPSACELILSGLHLATTALSDAEHLRHGGEVFFKSLAASSVAARRILGRACPRFPGGVKLMGQPPINSGLARWFLGPAGNPSEHAAGWYCSDPPSFDQHFGLLQCIEDLRVQDFVPEL